MPVASRALVALGWLLFFGFFLFRRSPAEPGGVKRDSVSLLGIALQGLAFAAVWMIQRPIPRAGAHLELVEVALDLAAPVLSIASAWFGLWAVRTLGRQWSYAARLIEGHQLIVAGPYRWVRHPIYTAMLGKLIATNFAFGHPLGLGIALVFYMAGTAIRIRSEERLLRGTFGTQYDDYARRVPALIPGIY
ncbi:MAG TPA: isoprenylcysteine carboxylmethyltransferase family protein [Candidatus Sulfotelmatobacter sp.]|nr:isoprenylcysteine carboxylmethyltransferase family protein [Candidatus Sulfotelmatobacter sp.]